MSGDGLWGRFAGRRTQRREGLDVPRLGQGALRMWAVQHVRHDCGSSSRRAAPLAGEPLISRGDRQLSSACGSGNVQRSPCLGRMKIAYQMTPTRIEATATISGVGSVARILYST